GIRVGVSEEVDFRLPAWAGFSERIHWHVNDPAKVQGSGPQSIPLLNEVVADYSEKITLVALGSLKTYADWLKANPQMLDKVERIVWYNNHTVEKGFNYQVSPESYRYIEALDVELAIVQNTSQLVVSKAYLNALDTAASVYARQIAEVHAQEELMERVVASHLQLWDDMVPLYMNAPLLFRETTDGDITRVSIPGALAPSDIHPFINQLLASSAQENNRVFIRFPVDTSLYTAAYANMLNATLARYGATEWKAIVLTNEIHGHTGIYSIIGAKMGVRMLNYFNVGVNTFSVISYAGLEPPLSCFNDGLQISSGATMGQGLITVSDSISTTPSAVFEFNGQRVSVALKEQIANQMQEEIRYGVKTYGALTDPYWLYIEELAITYWKRFNRNEIFEITRLN
ncbi:MAG: FmdE family protein, partial [Bacteroidales bacterium]